MTTFTLKLPEEAAERLHRMLSAPPYTRKEIPYTRVAASGDRVQISLYESGKLVVQGKGTADWVEFVLEPEVMQTTGLLTPEAAVAAPEAPLPRIGIDESGKGDYFGPMVIAGFRLTEALLPRISTLGIQDSKRIKSDDRIASMASALQETVPGDCEVMVLTPETYNRLVKEMGSVNRVLAWAHATVLENLLARHPDTKHAVADQFGPEHQIRSALKSQGKQIALQQRHKAESDPAVAAASILARHGFITEMKALGGLAGCPLPLGATHVRPTAEELVRRTGPEILPRLAKIHFRTTRQVLRDTGYDPGLLGTPEPKTWKRR